MADSTRVFEPGWQARDASGILSGAKIYFYLEETSTLDPAYSDAALTSALPNPVICDSGGFPTSDGNSRVTVWRGTANYRIKLAKSDDTTVWDFDNQPGAQVSASSAQGFEVGLIIPYSFLTAPSSKWLPLNGGTFGSANSGSSLRASDSQDTVSLYTGWWTTFDNTRAPILDSSGTPTTRGVSAAADFAANKRLPLLDVCGRSMFFADNMGGVASKNRLTGLSGGIDGDIPGYTGGNEKFTTSLAKLPVIDMDTYKTDTPHPHTYVARGVSSGTGGQTSGAADLDTQRTGTTSSNTTGISFSTFGSGEDTPHLPPGIVIPLLLVYGGNA